MGMDPAAYWMPIIAIKPMAAVIMVRRKGTRRYIAATYTMQASHSHMAV